MHLMDALLDSAGERISIDCALPWAADLIAEGAAGELEHRAQCEPTLSVRVESTGRSFDTRGWEVLTRGAWRRDGEVVVENACTAGFDLHLRCGPEHAEFTYRWRPPPRDRAAARVLRSRFHLLARALLTQYPALWWAGTSGRAPLHASACVAGGSTPMVSAPSGVGRSTLILDALAGGGRATGDNLAVGDGTILWGLVEPMRVEGGAGRRMPHGRNETPMPDRERALEPDSLIVLERGRSGPTRLVACTTDAAARSLATSTYMAGELRRFWPFAATLAAGTGVGPSHPPVHDVACAFAVALPCFTLQLGRTPGAPLAHLLDTMEVAA